MRNILAAVALSLLIPAGVMAHDLRLDSRVPATGVNDKGELILQQEKFSYKKWKSSRDSAHCRALLRQRDERRADRGD
jgi:predicted transcriptional regulator